MSKYADKQFWIDTADRAAATFAQTLGGALGVGSIGLLEVDWTGALSLAGAAALVSVLTSINFRGRGEATPTYS